jgi:hypothetical protein
MRTLISHRVTSWCGPEVQIETRTVHRQVHVETPPARTLGLSSEITDGQHYEPGRRLSNKELVRENTKSASTAVAKPMTITGPSLHTCAITEQAELHCCPSSYQSLARNAQVFSVRKRNPVVGLIGQSFTTHKGGLCQGNLVFPWVSRQQIPCFARNGNVTREKPNFC